MLYVGLTNILFLLRYALAGRGGARKQIYAVVLFGLFLFSAFRYQVGCDWSGYYFQYAGAANFDWSTLRGCLENRVWGCASGFGMIQAMDVDATEPGSHGPDCQEDEALSE